VRVNTHIHAHTQLYLAFFNFLSSPWLPNCLYPTVVVWGVFFFKLLHYFLIVAELLVGWRDIWYEALSYPWGHLTSCTTWCEFWHRPPPQMFWWYVGQRERSDVGLRKERL